MTDASNVVPPQPKREIVLRRIKARRFAQATMTAGVGFLVIVLFNFDSVVSHTRGLAFWCAIFLFASVCIFALLWSFFFFTEQPKEVEVVRYPVSDTHVIHLTPKQ